MINIHATATSSSALCASLRVRAREGRGGITRREVEAAKNAGKDVLVGWWRMTIRGGMASLFPRLPGTPVDECERLARFSAELSRWRTKTMKEGKKGGFR